MSSLVLRSALAALVLCAGCGSQPPGATIAIEPPAITPREPEAPATEPPASAPGVDVVGPCGRERDRVLEVLTTWSDAQTAGDPDAYFGTYLVDAFVGVVRTSSGSVRRHDFASWRAIRAKTFERPIETELGSPRVVSACDGGLAAGEAEALFIQRWRSNGFADHGVKYVRLRTNPDGEYRIAYEDMLTHSAGWEEIRRRARKNDARATALKARIRRALAIKAGRSIERGWDADYGADRSVPQGSTALVQGEISTVVARFGSEHSGEIWTFGFAGDQLVYADREEWSWAFADCADGRVDRPCTHETKRHTEVFLHAGDVIRVVRSAAPQPGAEEDGFDGVTGDTLALCAHWWRLFAAGSRPFASHFALGAPGCVD